MNSITLKPKPATIRRNTQAKTRRVFAGGFLRLEHEKRHSTDSVISPQGIIKNFGALRLRGPFSRRAEPGTARQ